VSDRYEFIDAEYAGAADGQYPQLNDHTGVGIGSMTRVSGPRGFGRFPGSAALAG